ncbi:hypothetical protein VTI74DRAFT_9216 [Chaetomium olivicolor]
MHSAGMLNSKTNTPKPGDQSNTTVKSRTKIIGPIFTCLTDNNGQRLYRGSCSGRVAIQTLRVCRGGCTDLNQCTCGTNARTIRAKNGQLVVSTTEEMLAAAAINTVAGEVQPGLGSGGGWLAGQLALGLGPAECRAAKEGDGLSEEGLGAAEGEPCGRGSPTQAAAIATRTVFEASVDLVRVVMVATAVYLSGVRKLIGAMNMWEEPATEGFNDFEPVVLGP